MKVTLTLLMICLFFTGFAQEPLERLGTTSEINVKEKATNSQPLIVVQNVVYSMPEGCFCNRDLDADNLGRDAGKDDSDRNRGDRNTGRNADADDADRNAGGDNSDRNLGTDFIYRDLDDAEEGRDSGSDDSDRDLGDAASGRKSGDANSGRDSGAAADGRNSGSAANGRAASGANMGRSLATAHIPPSCEKVDKSCSIQILGFHPKANVEYFDKVESIKANGDMIIKF